MTTKEIIRQIAETNGTTPEQVATEMRKAIRTAMVSTDPHAQELWRQIAPDGKEPSIGRFIKFCVNRLQTTT